jgi:hypothetical protein
MRHISLLMTHENGAEALWDVALYLQQAALWMRTIFAHVLQQHQVQCRMLKLTTERIIF